MALFIGGSARAATIISNPPDQSGGSDLNLFAEADDFMLSSQAQITQIKFWALQSTPADFAGTMDWAFYSDLSGAPGVPVISGNTAATGSATGNSTFGLDEYAYSFSVNALLSSGTYWLVLHNGPTAVLPETNFYWAWSNGNGGNSVSQDLSSPPLWVGNSAELAFELTAADAAPEPISTSLVGGGLLAGWFLRRKQKGLKG
jgi:hypothetical protein